MIFSFSPDVRNFPFGTQKKNTFQMILKQVVFIQNSTFCIKVFSVICLLLIHMLDHIISIGKIFQSVNHNIGVLWFDFTDGNNVNLISVGFVQISHQDVSYELGSGLTRSLWIKQVSINNWSRFRLWFILVITSKSSEINVSSGSVIRDQFKTVVFLIRSLWKILKYVF